jgi:hypothetical protein
MFLIQAVHKELLLVVTVGNSINERIIIVKSIEAEVMRHLWCVMHFSLPVIYIWNFVNSFWRCKQFGIGTITV